MTGVSVCSLCTHTSLASWTPTQLSLIEGGCGGLEGGYSHLVKQHLCSYLNLWLSRCLICGDLICGACSLRFTIPGVTAFLSEKLCQDPLEKFFGCQRQRGGVNDNPTVHQFCLNTQTLQTAFKSSVRICKMYLCVVISELHNSNCVF